MWVLVMDLLGLATRSAAAAVVALALSDPDAEQTPQTEQMDIYYRSQAEADMELEQFDRVNPSCQLWTNWQNTCARSGVEGLSRCSVDPRIMAVPSTPFCVFHRQTLAQPVEGVAGFSSVMRFCAETELITSTNETDSPTLIACKRFVGERPFSDPRSAGAFTNWCNRWRSQRGAMRCVRWNVPSWCNRAVVSGTGQLSKPLDVESDSIQIPWSPPPTHTVSINVIFCLEEA